MDLSYVVVRNDEEQYSIWPEDAPIPDGWVAQTHACTKDECLAYIRENWKDMRPASLRCAMGG